jgi:hypothetical protein
MSCESIVGVKNIVITFTNCDTGQVIGPVSHKLSGDELPKFRMFDRVYSDLPGGYVKMKQDSFKIEIKVIRSRRIPLADYQGRSSIDIQVEMEDGLVYTGISGGNKTEESSDAHEVSLMISFREGNASELLPPGALAAA